MGGQGSGLSERVLAPLRRTIRSRRWIKDRLFRTAAKIGCRHCTLFALKTNPLEASGRRTA
jgi:hypothetical protein